MEFPLTHDLEALLSILEAAEIFIPESLQEAGALTPYAVETRYPGFWGEISEQDMQEALALAQQAVSWAEELLVAQE